MKKFALFAALLISSNAFAGELTDYDMVKNAVIQGKQIRIVTDLSKCEALNERYASFSVGAYTPNEVIIEDDGTIAASLSHFTNSKVNNESYIQFVRYTITKDYKVNMTIKVLDALTKRALFMGMEYVCPINSGAHIYTA